MGFDENNYSPIPPVGKAAVQQRATGPTSTPKLMVGADLNTLDPTLNRGKVNRINSKLMVGADLNILDPTHNRGKVNRINSFTTVLGTGRNSDKTVQKKTSGEPRC